MALTKVTYSMIKGAVFNPLDYGADPTGNTDSSAAIQAAIDDAYNAGGGEVFFPAGRYLVENTLTIQLTYTDNIYIKLRGVGCGQAAVAPNPTSTYGSLLVGQTGGILIDMSGGCNTIFEDIGLFAGPTNSSTIGIFLQRVNDENGNGYCQNNKFIRIAIGMGTNPSIYTGVGTIAIMNKRGEHHSHKDCWYYADTPIILDGNSAYSSITSPFYPESYPGGATLGNNIFLNTSFLAASHNCIEAITTNTLTIIGAYFLAADGYAGILLSTYNRDVILDNAHVEYSGSGTSLSFIRAVGNAVGLRVSSTTNLSNYTLLRTSTGATVKNADIQVPSDYTVVFDHATESGGPLYAATIRYDSSTGATVPTDYIYNSVVMDSNSATPNQMDIRALDPPKAVVTGYGAVLSTADGNDTTTSATVTYICELNIPASTLITGASVLAGSTAAGNVKIYLIDRNGAVVAQTNSFSVTGANFQFAGNNFTSAYFARGPGKYYIGVQCSDNASANKIRTYTLGLFGTTGRTGTTFGSLSDDALNVPVGFAGNVGPIVSTY